MSVPSNIGSKRLVVGAHYGLADWLAQRFTAVVMACYSVLLLAVFFWMHDFTYNGWAGLFNTQWVKVATFVTLLSLFYHVWVGMRDIWMDYIKPASLRMVFQALTIVWLLGCAGYALQILWSV
jgi:succinate dehydrogenase / fumarate reductase membrane anchor subunit